MRNAMRPAEVRFLRGAIVSPELRFALNSGLFSSHASVLEELAHQTRSVGADRQTSVDRGNSFDHRVDRHSQLAAFASNRE